jgi:hypothetical protein
MDGGRNLRQHIPLVTMQPSDSVRINIREICQENTAHLGNGKGVDSRVEDDGLGNLLKIPGPATDPLDGGLEKGICHMPSFVPLLDVEPQNRGKMSILTSLWPWRR